MDFEKESKRLVDLPYRLPVHLCNILDGFKKAIYKKNTSVVLIVDGRSGMGKTTLTNQIGKYCDPNYCIEKLHYEPESFLDGGSDKIGLAQAKQGDVIVFDEAMLISSRSALSAINRMIIQALSMIRSKKIVVVFCVNSIFDLDKNLALSRADMLLHVYGDSLTDRGKFCAFFKGIDGQDRLKMLYLLGKKYYDYAKPKSNFFSRFSSCFVLPEDEYERQKQIGVNNFLKTITKGKVAKDTIARDKMVYHLKELKGMSPEDIADISGISRATVFRIIQRIKTKGGIER